MAQPRTGVKRGNRNLSGAVNAGSARNRNSRKNQKEEKKAGIFFFNLFIAVIIVICVLHAFNNLFSAVQRHERLEELSREHNSLRIQNDSLRNKLEKSRQANRLDEDYIISVARANGLRKDSDIIFFLQLEE